jgi:hypothetical protein
MATIAGRWTLARPGPGPELLPYGLFKVAPPQSGMDGHAFIGGLVYQTPFCKQGQGYAVNCPPGSKAASFTGGYTNASADPFMVLVGSECGAMSGDENRSPDQYSEDLVVNALRAQEQRLVENIFSTGAVGQAPSLSSGGTQLAAAANVVTGIQALEAAFAAVYGLPAVIHIPIVASAMIMNAHLLDKDSAGVWRTALGNAVSFGNYAGNRVDTGVAPAAGHTTLAITGQVSVWRNDIFVSDWEASIDKITNQVHRYAERTYLVDYECAPLGVDVDFTVCC